MKNNGWALLIGIALVISAGVLSNAYKYKFRSQDTVTVTGLGEQEFTSDQVVWRAWVVADNSTLEATYADLERSRKMITDFIKSAGVADSSLLFLSVGTTRSSEPIYSGGNYVGQKYTGYNLRQELKVESSDIDVVEKISREISQLIAQGVVVESTMPEYYYSKLSSLKIDLIKSATEDGLKRAETIADEAGAKVHSLKSGKMGVFQITGANSNEAFSWGGTYNSYSKIKKASITIKLEYHIR